MRFSAASESKAANVLTFVQIERVENVVVGRVVLPLDAHLIDPKSGGDHQVVRLGVELDS